jgi:hypothetical protein
MQALKNAIFLAVFTPSLIFAQNSSEYSVVFGSFSWLEAKLDAEARGGHLVTITSEEENRIVGELLAPQITGEEQFWMGATDSEEEGIWTWITGEQWLYDNWGGGQPDNWRSEDYGAFIISSFLNIYWNDNDGSSNSSSGYILETPAPKPIEEWINDGLVAYYPFDGDAKDASGNGNDGEFVGDIQSAGNRFGLSAGALSFPGAPPNHVEIGSTAELQFAANNQGTISFWMLLGDFIGRKHIMGARPAGKWRYQIMVEGDSIDFFGTGQPGGTSLITDLAHLETSTWHHYVYSVTPGFTKLYVDGVLLDKVAGNTLGVVTDFVFTIGNVGNPGSPNDFDDSLDDIRFYNRALSATEVAELYFYESNLNYPAKADASVVAGFVVGTNILWPGAGYDNQPEIKFIGGSPVEEAQAEAVIDDGSLVAINITNAGSGYKEVPSIRIESPPSQALLSIGISKIETIVPESERPRRAIATANVINGFLVSADIVEGGAGYEQAPIVTVSDATGTGALAAATIENGVVTSVQFVKAGIGYSDKALIQFQSPPPNPDAIPRATEVELSMQLRFPNNYYTIEASSDLNNWEQIAEPFFAEETTHTVKVEVGDGDMRYFRAIQLH